MDPVSVLRGARAFARDFPRDGMPPGYLWDVCDFVPEVVDSILTGRGSWAYVSDALGGDIESGILSTFRAGEQLLVQDSTGQLTQLTPSVAYPPPIYTAVNRGAIPRAIQPPLQVFEDTVWFDRDGLSVPQIVQSAGAPIAMDATAPKARVGAVWNGYLIGAGVPGAEDTLYFGPPGPKTTGAWDVNSYHQTAMAVTGLATVRGMGLVFHASSVERLRGTTAPNTAAGDPGDLILEPLFARVGCTDPRSICYWNENVLFADERGVQITDGAVVRNLCQQGSIAYYWRQLYQNQASLAACVFMDYYVISVVRTDGNSDTLICDLNARQWFRFSNVESGCFISSGGSTGMERFWGGIVGTKKLATLGPTFFPTSTAGIDSDGNGVAVLPYLQTPWYRLAPEGRKRVKNIYLSYDAQVQGADTTIANLSPPVLDIGYMRSPQQANYLDLGSLPATSQYTRFRLPVRQQPYGIAFQVKTTTPTSALRLYDLAVDAYPVGRSNL